MQVHWLLGLLLMLLVHVSAHAQAPTFVAGSSRNLNLGVVNPGASTGTVRIAATAAGALSRTGGTTLNTTASYGSAAKQSGAFRVGRGSTATAANFRITLSTTPFTLTSPGVSGTLSCSALVSAPAAGASNRRYSSYVTTPVYLGATVNIGTSTTARPGVYTGSFVVTLRDVTTNLTATQTFTVTVRIQAAPALAISWNSVPLNFGLVLRPSSGTGTVTLSPSGTPTYSNVVPLTHASYPISTPTFTVTGTSNATFALTAPTGSINLTGPGGATMPLSAFTTSPSLIIPGVTTGKGSLNFSLGATLTVSSTQTSGDYTLTFPVTVSYN